ncbi:IS110 family transposase [Streptomyces sp. NPDC005393]|uniref:IS110 family transposase n=1 Tax=Streptomyces sp. NPDC005393 TaxID=3157041 RepID=UPI0033AB9CF9
MPALPGRARPPRRRGRPVGHTDHRAAGPAGARHGHRELDTIPGIGPAAAQIIIAETGGDMARFATPGHLASWIEVCPGMNESAGVTKSGRTRPGNSNLKRLLGIAAMSVTRNNDCYLSAYYRRIAARRDRQHLLPGPWHRLLHPPRPRTPMWRVAKEANRLGLTVRFEPISAA